MHYVKFTKAPRKRSCLLLGLILCIPLAVKTAAAQTVQLEQLDRNYKVVRSDGTRIKKLRNTNCSNCSASVTNEKSEYLSRVISGNSSREYERVVESHVFADTKFVNGCWKDAIDKGMEFFFTISETGVASDFAWFPKHGTGKCIKRHIAAIEFPEPEKPHHSWLLVTGQEY